RVQLVGRPGNASATGAKIRLHEAGDPGRLLAYEQVAVWGRQSFHSYYAARQTERHFGLGQRSAVDVSVEFYPAGRRVERKNVPADGTVVIAEQDPCPGPTRTRGPDPTTAAFLPNHQADAWSRAGRRPACAPCGLTLCHCSPARKTMRKHTIDLLGRFR